MSESPFSALPESQGGHMKEDDNEAIIRHIQEIKQQLIELEQRIRVKYGIRETPACSECEINLDKVDTNG